MANQGDIARLKVALVHDELVRRGGAERVFEAMARLLPHADIYSLYAGHSSFVLDGQRRPIHTTFLQRFPAWWRRHPRRVLPLLPYAAEQLDLSDYDVVISSSSGFAKAIVTRAHIPHICYCHTPTRYLWEAHYTKLPAMALLHLLRLADFAAAQRVDVWLANSEWTRERIATYYRHDSEVVYPPIDTGFFTPASTKTSAGNAGRDYFLCVGRLSPAKKFAQAIAVCEKLELPLVIVGEGPEKRSLERLAKKYTRLVGHVDRETLRTYYRGARALLQPAEEDFGMASAEAQACGTPVIAYGRGGVAEIVRDGETGLLYQPARVESLAETLRQFLQREENFNPAACQQGVLKFDTAEFNRRFIAAIQKMSSQWSKRMVQ